MIYSVIMAGGTGTRFWPKSRSKNPKQFLALWGSKSLLQLTKERIARFLPEENVFVVTNQNYLKKVVEQLPEVSPKNVFVEPVRRETATCIGLATLKLSNIDPEGIIIVLTSDHYIADEVEFFRTLNCAVEVARNNNYLVALGMNPTIPKTGYGYLRLGKKIAADCQGKSIYAVEKFTEKPDLATANQFVQSGNYLWNSGMYIFRASVMMDAIRQYLPKLAFSLAQIKMALGTDEEEKVMAENYHDIEKVSIDYGIMEKASNVAVVPASFGWDDLGSWTVLSQILPPDAGGNVIQGQHVGIDTANCIISGEDKLVATLGVRDLVIIQSSDVVLICQKERDQDVKELVKKVRAFNLRDFL